MRYQILGQSELNVSEICLGTMTFGEQNTETQAHQQLDMAIDYGVNFIDTAEMYSIPPRAETYGETEAIIGRWLRKTGSRSQVILASKVIGQAEWMPHVRGGRACLNKTNIEAAVDASLKRLQTDYLDLYQLHWPDRKTNFFGHLNYQYPKDDPPTSIEETLQALAGLVEAGKIRYFGVSNETPWGVMQYLKYSERYGWPRPISIQNPYSLLNRSYEVGLAEISRQEQVPLLAYSPLGFGVLTGKYLEGPWPENARLSLFPGYKRYSTDNGIAATREYVALARRHGMSPAQMALAYVNRRPFMGANIVGATTLEQLRENLASSEFELSTEVLEEIDNIHTRYPNPCP